MQAFNINDKVIVNKILTSGNSFLHLKKPELGTIINIVFNCGPQSIYEVQLDRDKRIGDTWAVYYWDLKLIK